eukprot:1314695-Pleurochrysis_carterae.AAC.1
MPRRMLHVTTKHTPADWRFVDVDVRNLTQLQNESRSCNVNSSNAKSKSNAKLTVCTQYQ